MMVCTQCGFRNETEDAFCGSCGAFLEWAGEKVETDGPTPAPVTTVATQAPAAGAATAPSVEPTPDEAPATEAFPPGPSSTFRGEVPAPPEAESQTEPVVASPRAQPSAGEETVVDLRAESRSPEPQAAAGVDEEADAKGQERATTGPRVGTGAVSLSRPAPPADRGGAAETPEAPRPGPAVGTGTPAGVAPRAQVQTPTASPARPPAQTSPSAPARTAQTPMARTPGSGPPSGPVARRPDLKPPGAKPRPVPSKPPPKRDLRPGDLVCNQCQEGNDPNRKFCRRCGASLVEAVEAVPPPPLPWWKRLFVRQPKVVAAGERPMRRGGSSAQRDLRSRLRRLRRVTALLAALGLGVGFVGPWRSSVINLPRSLREKVAPTLTLVRPSGVTASSSLPAHPPERITDGKTGPGKHWAEGVNGDGVGERLVVTFEPAINLKKIGFSTGVSQEDPEEFQKQPRPETVRLHFGNGPTKDLTLEDDGKFQFKDVNAKDVRELQIEIRSVYRSLQSGSDTSIGELEFLKGR